MVPHFVSEEVDVTSCSLYVPVMPSRLKDDRPMSRQQFEELFPDDGACARHLAELRWGDGFACPACGGTKGWELKGERFVRECADCGRQTSVTAGTVVNTYPKLTRLPPPKLTHLVPSFLPGSLFPVVRPAGGVFGRRKDGKEVGSRFSAAG